MKTNEEKGKKEGEQAAEGERREAVAVEHDVALTEMDAGPAMSRGGPTQIAD